ncbi:hypothetical protein [Mesomycoplasma dispar]|uniref:hypothetical protein n=1 Tax=Mesomycoplasma dispar TaxID=86660 RepID=UPI001E60BF4E|nr:hypothetical protein [Mesomycoplasma dispar]
MLSFSACLFSKNVLSSKIVALLIGDFSSVWLWLFWLWLWSFFCLLSLELDLELSRIGCSTVFSPQEEIINNGVKSKKVTLFIA